MYQIIGDNVDIHQRASHQSMERRDRDHHWFHLYAVRDRVTGVELPNDSPTADISQLPLNTFLPSVQDCNSLRSEFGVFISRVITEKIPYLHTCRDIVLQHIPHKYSTEMMRKSEIVSVVTFPYFA